MTIFFDFFHSHLFQPIVTVVTMATGTMSGEEFGALYPCILFEQAQGTCRRDTKFFGEFSRAMPFKFSRFDSRLIILVSSVFLQGNRRQKGCSGEQCEGECNIESVTQFPMPDEGHQSNDTHNRARNVKRTKCQTQFINFFDLQESEQK